MCLCFALCSKVPRLWNLSVGRNLSWWEWALSLDRNAQHSYPKGWNCPFWLDFFFFCPKSPQGSQVHLQLSNGILLSRCQFGSDFYNPGSGWKKLGMVLHKLGNNYSWLNDDFTFITCQTTKVRWKWQDWYRLCRSAKKVKWASYETKKPAGLMHLQRKCLRQGWHITNGSRLA